MTIWEWGTVVNAMRQALVFCPLLLGSAVATAGEQGQVDPAAVSEGLKAIFRYGTSTQQTSERLNANTVTVMSGTIGGTYVQFGADLESVLDDGDNLRVLAIVGRGSVQSVVDILFLKGVDMGIVRADTLDYLERKGFANNIKRQFTYITKLYNEEMHVIAPKSVQRLQDLEGKIVSVDLPNGGTFVTSITVFERLGIKANFVYIEQRVAYDKLKKGELDAVIAVQGKPSRTLATQGRQSPSRPGRLRQTAAGRLFAGGAHRGRLSESDREGWPRRHHCGARRARRLQLGAEHRPLSPTAPFRRNLLRQNLGFSEAAVSSEMEGGCAQCAARRLGAVSSGPAMVGQKHQCHGVTQPARQLRAVSRRSPRSASGRLSAGRPRGAVSSVPRMAKGANRGTLVDWIERIGNLRLPGQRESTSADGFPASEKHQPASRLCCFTL
jgi:hypothetical protein